MDTGHIFRRPLALLRTLIIAAVALNSPPLVQAANPADEVARLIEQAGNTDDEKERRAILERLSTLPHADASLQRDATTLAGFIRTWNEGGLKFYNGQFRERKIPTRGQVKYDFGIAAGSPLQPLTDLYLGRIIAWNLIENSNVRSSPELGPLFKESSVSAFRRYSQSFPANRIARMYLGETIPWPKTFAPSPGAPAWAVLQRENLERLRDIILWWIDHRMKPDGQFGGGWGDDCEMWRWWASVLLGFDDPKIREAQLRFSRSALERVGPAGFHDTVTDVEHAAEPTTDNLVPLMVLEPDEPRWQAWALRFAPLMREVWTGRNARGQLQFKSFYFSNREVSPAPARALDVIANVGAINPTLLAWQRTGEPGFGALVTAWLDTWVDATARAENGKPAGVLPAAIRWPDGQSAGAGANWWEPVVRGGFMHSYYIWPSVITELTDAMVVAYIITKHERYLAPIRSMAALRLRHLQTPLTGAEIVGSEAWCADQLAPRKNANSNTGGIVKTVARLKALTGTKEFDPLLALEGAEFVVDPRPEGRRDLEAALRESVEALRVNFAGFTSEVRSTDRVMRFAQFFSRDYRFDDYVGVTLPKHELLYRMVTGDANAPRFPQMAVRWLTPPQDIAVFVTEAGLDRFEAELYHFGREPRPITAELRMLRPGRYQATLVGTGGRRQSLGEALTIEPGRFGLLRFALPAQQACTLQVERSERQ